MKENTSPNLVPFKKYVLRTPLYSLNFKDFLLKIDLSDNTTLKNLCNNQDIKKAIFLASPELYSEMDKWLNGMLREEKVPKLQLSIFRYLLRMSTRCTPFGYFAGVSVGGLSNNSKILISKDSIREHIRLDMDILCLIKDHLTSNLIIRQQLLFYPNTTIYKVSNKIRYIEYSLVNNIRYHNISGIEGSYFINKVLQKSLNGIKFKKLVKYLTKQNINIEDATDFLNELINNQILISEIEPNITGVKYLDRLICTLGNLKLDEESNNILKILSEIKDTFQSKQTLQLSDYARIQNLFNTIDIKYNQKYLFQNDIYKDLKESDLNQMIIPNLLNGIEILNKLSRRHNKTNLSDFKDRFKKRFENEAIPLLKALDPELGINYLNNHDTFHSPLIDELNFLQSRNNNEKISVDNSTKLLLKKYIKAIRNNEFEISLTNNDFRDFKSDLGKMFKTFSIVVEIIGDNKDHMQKIHIKSLTGPSASNLLGRFCHLNKDLFKLTSEITKAEDSKDKSFINAEIIHLPESRIGNILLRPILREYEIPFLAKSGVKYDKQIKLDDLYLKISQNELQLISKSLNKQVIPRLTSAHNYTLKALPIYQFLCDLQSQHADKEINFNWGGLEKLIEFLPRVTYKNIILSRAMWIINTDSLKNLYNKKDDNKLIKEFDSFKSDYKLFKEVVLTDADNELYLDLENINCIKILLDLTKKRQYFQLTEFLNNKNSIVKDTNGYSYSNEFIISFNNQNI